MNKNANTRKRPLLMVLLLCTVLVAMAGTFFVFSSGLSALNLTAAPRGVLGAGVVIVSMVVGAIVALIGDRLINPRADIPGRRP